MAKTHTLTYISANTQTDTNDDTAVDDIINMNTHDMAEGEKWKWISPSVF